RSLLGSLGGKPPGHGDHGALCRAEGCLGGVPQDYSPSGRSDVEHDTAGAGEHRPGVLGGIEDQVKLVSRGVVVENVQPAVLCGGLLHPAAFLHAVTQIDRGGRGHLVTGPADEFDRLFVRFGVHVAPDDHRPSSANRSAAARPWPPPVPVIRATLPSSRPMNLSPFKLRILRPVHLYPARRRKLGEELLTLYFHPFYSF